MGGESRELVQRLSITEEGKTAKVILNVLEEYFSPRPSRNILYERYMFHSTEQKTDENVDQFVIRLKKWQSHVKLTVYMTK